MRFSPTHGATSAFVCVLAAWTGEGIAQPQAGLEPAPAEARTRLASFLEDRERAQRRLDVIEHEESANGPYSAALIDHLQSLALLYGEIGDADLAAEAMLKALQVERANFGLFTLDQVPLIEQLIDAERERGNGEAVAKLEQRLLRLAYHHPSDLRSADILNRAGDRHLGRYTLHVDGALPPQVSINIGFAGMFRSGPRSSARSSIFRAQQHYFDAIAVMLRTGAITHEALRATEKKLLYTYYLELTESDPSGHRIEALSSLGNQSHERLVAYEELSDASLEEVARARVELADWKLLFSRNNTALDHYREVYAMLAAAEGYEELIAELFMPETPIVLPAFVPSPLVSAGPTDESYVEVAFQISRYGKGRGITIVGMDGESADDGAKGVARLIARGRFRPIFRDGEPARSPSVVRYRF